MNFKIIKNNKGFTLVESLVAIAVLSIAIVSTFTAVQVGLKSSLVAKDQITAFYLAQEALEYIKNVRDENALNSVSGVSTNWLKGISELTTDPCWYGGSGVAQKTCRIDSFHPNGIPAIAECVGGTGTCPNLNKDSSTGLFGYSSGGTWSATNFKREIKLTKISSDNIDVTITMTWTSGASTNTFQVTGTVFNRQ